MNKIPEEVQKVDLEELCKEILYGIKIRLEIEE